MTLLYKNVCTKRNSFVTVSAGADIDRIPLYSTDLAHDMSEKSYSTGSEFPPLAPGKMRLYSMRFCPFAQRTRLVLAHKNIKHETVNVNLKQKPEGIFDKNPNGTVPIIELDGKVLYESLVTSDYLDEIYPENKLTPSDPYQKAKDKLFIERFCKLVSGFFKFVKEYTQEDVQTFLSNMDIVEKMVAARGTPFLGGKTVQMVDLMVWPHAERLAPTSKMSPDATLPPERYPKFMQWIKNMGEVPAVKKCRFDVDTHVHFVKSSLTGKPDYDYML